MNRIDELDVYLRLKDLELEHPYTDEISLRNGRFNPSEEAYTFDIDLSDYKKLEKIRGGYSFKLRNKEYQCNILDLTSKRVKLGIRDLREERIEAGAISVDMRNIVKREKWGLDQLREERHSLKRLILFGADIISGGVRMEGCEFENESLNAEQKRAVEYAVGVRDVYLIWGPPGTGKTSIVPEIVSNYIRLHEGSNPKILVCSYTNRAVDNVVVKLFRRFSIVRFGDSTLTEEYKDALFDELLKKKRREVEKELGGFEERINQLLREQEKIKKERMLKSKEAEKVEKDKEVIKSEIETLNTEILQIKKLITEREHSLLKTNLKKEIDKLNEELWDYEVKLKDFQERGRKINREIEEIEIEIRRLNGDVSGIREQLNGLKKSETDIANIIHIVNYYLENAKRNKIAVFWNKWVFKRKNRLYRQYEKEITELQLGKRNGNELEKIQQEKMGEQKKEQEKIARLQNELNEGELKLGEGEKELTRKKDELSSIEESLVSLLENRETGEKKIEKLKSGLDSLDLGELEYDGAALRRKDPELRELYDALSKKQSDREQKEAYLEGIVQKRSFFIGIIEKLENSIKEIINRIKVMEKEMQQEMEEKIEKARLAILNENQIIATTNLRAYDKLFDNIGFNLVIMDEAGSIDLPGAVIPFLRGKKSILLGDPNQLPPILAERIPKIESFIEEHPEVRQSIFEKLFKDNYGENRVIMLRSQYRMKREIADFVSTFYNTPLNTPIEVEEKLEAYGDDVISSHYSMICFWRRFWTSYRRRSAFSIGEIRFVKNIIERFRERYGDGILEEIAIISPYRAQADMIAEEIPNVECATVHTFQGREKSIVIFATAKYWSRSGEFGYLLGDRRGRNLLNVAISRAKEKFIIVGSKELFEGVEIYRRLYEHIGRVGYVAPEHIKSYDFENRCEVCGSTIEDRYRLCKDCIVLDSLRNFLEERPRTWRAADGDLLRSSDEVRIDDWFHRNEIEHEVERRVQRVDRLMYCDWFLPRGGIYVEYWGLTEEDWYREAKRVKQRLYRQHELKLISIEREDMRNLDEVLRHRFRDD